MCTDQWSDLVKQSYLQLLHFFENSAIPSVMEHYGFGKDREILEILKWQYPDRVREGDANSLLGKLLDVSRPDISVFHFYSNLLTKKSLVPILTKRCVIKRNLSFQQKVSEDVKYDIQGKRRKALPVTGRGGPKGCETSRLPHFF
jgi:hypothetical protein